MVGVTIDKNLGPFIVVALSHKYAISRIWANALKYRVTPGENPVMDFSWASILRTYDSIYHPSRTTSINSGDHGKICKGIWEYYRSGRPSKNVKSRIAVMASECAFGMDPEKAFKHFSEQYGKLPVSAVEFVSGEKSFFPQDAFDEFIEKNDLFLESDFLNEIKNEVADVKLKAIYAISAGKYTKKGEDIRSLIQSTVIKLIAFQYYMFKLINNASFTYSKNKVTFNVDLPVFETGLLKTSVTKEIVAIIDDPEVMTFNGVLLGFGMHPLFELDYFNKDKRLARYSSTSHVVYVHIRKRMDYSNPFDLMPRPDSIYVNPVLCVGDDHSTPTKNIERECGKTTILWPKWDDVGGKGGSVIHHPDPWLTTKYVRPSKKSTIDKETDVVVPEHPVEVCSENDVIIPTTERDAASVEIMDVAHGEMTCEIRNSPSGYVAPSIEFHRMGLRGRMARDGKRSFRVGKGFKRAMVGRARVPIYAKGLPRRDVSHVPPSDLEKRCEEILDKCMRLEVERSDINDLADIRVAHIEDVGHTPNVVLHKVKTISVPGCGNLLIYGSDDVM